MKNVIIKAGFIIVIAVVSVQIHAILGSYNRSQVLLDATADHILTLPQTMHGVDTRPR
jgi:hypothetical protein